MGQVACMPSRFEAGLAFCKMDGLSGLQGGYRAGSAWDGISAAAATTAIVITSTTRYAWILYIF
jgi:hypothetical protein